MKNSAKTTVWFKKLGAVYWPEYHAWIIQHVADGAINMYKDGAWVPLEAAMRLDAVRFLEGRIKAQT